MRKKIFIAIMVLLMPLVVLYFFFPGTMFRFFASLERGRAGLTPKTIQAGEYMTPYLEGGQGETVLLIHGFGGDKDNFTRMARYLTGKYRVIAPDLPGFGENERKADKTYAYTNQLPRLVRFVDALKLEKFHVAGNSMGGQLAGLLAVAEPGRILSLTLINNAGFREPQMSEREKLVAQGTNPLLVNDVEDFDRLMSFIFVKKPFVPGPLKHYFAERAVQNRAFNEKIYKEIASERYLLQQQFSRIQAPVLVIWGDTDRVIDVSSTETMKQIKPDIKVEVMKQTGHVPMLEKPREIAGIYLDFINKLNQ